MRCVMSIFTCFTNALQLFQMQDRFAEIFIFNQFPFVSQPRASIAMITVALPIWRTPCSAVKVVIPFQDTIWLMQIGGNFIKQEILWFPKSFFWSLVTAGMSACYSCRCKSLVCGQSHTLCHSLKGMDVWFRGSYLMNAKQYLEENHIRLINTQGGWWTLAHGEKWLNEISCQIYCAGIQIGSQCYCEKQINCTCASVAIPYYD